MFHFLCVAATAIKSLRYTTQASRPWPPDQDPGSLIPRPQRARGRCRVDPLLWRDAWVARADPQRVLSRCPLKSATDTCWPEFSDVGQSTRGFHIPHHCAGIVTSCTPAPRRPPTPARSPGRWWHLGLTFLEPLLNHSTPFVELGSDFGKQPTLVLSHRFLPFD